MKFLYRVLTSTVPTRRRMFNNVAVARPTAVECWAPGLRKRNVQRNFEPKLRRPPLRRKRVESLLALDEGSGLSLMALRPALPRLASVLRLGLSSLVLRRPFRGYVEPRKPRPHGELLPRRPKTMRRHRKRRVRLREPRDAERIKRSQMRRSNCLGSEPPRREQRSASENRPRRMRRPRQRLLLVS